MRTHDQDMIITNADLQRLLPVIDQHARASESLETELHRAVIVDQRAVPADVVTMNSEVVYEDCETFAKRRVKLVYPRDADASRGTKRIRVLEIHYQPEACGDFDR